VMIYFLFYVEGYKTIKELNHLLLSAFKQL
jgi:hypothetical protein